MALAQTTVTGTVVDTKGEPMPGAKVQVKGTNDYVLTNMDGTFSVELADPKSKLVSQYVGWNSAAKTAKDGMVIKMSKDNWLSEKPTGYQWFVDVNVTLPDYKPLKSMSPGIMLGMVKNIGWYVKGQFNGLTSDHDCDTWLTGKTKTEYWAAMGGGIIRLGCPIYLYAGAGYASYRVLDEHACGGYSSREEYYKYGYEGSNCGVIVDLGLMIRYKHLFLQGGVQGETHGDLEHLPMNIGIGYIF